MTTAKAGPTAGDEQVAQTEPRADLPPSDPWLLLKGFVSLRRLMGMYPPGHPVVAQKLAELDDTVQRHLRCGPSLRIDVIGCDIYLNGVACRADTLTTAPVVHELADLGIHSIHIHHGIEREELLRVGEFLSEIREGVGGERFEARLARRGVSHVSLGRVVPLDTRWRSAAWPDAPTGPLDPSYAESLLLAQQTFETVTAGRTLDPVTVHDLVELLTWKVARSSAALAQILAVKQYENLTYCHSVNVALISLLLAKRLALDQSTMAGLVEAALLHDIGKTQVSLEIVRKPRALDKHERRQIERHPIYGAEILIETDAIHPLSATVALEHHLHVGGGGYPDLGDGAVPHLLTQIVSVADVYEAVTGARSYQPPRPPEQACLILARQAGSHFNTAVVKALVSAVTFFPIGSLVRTNRGEKGIVIRTNPADPLHPLLTLLNEGLDHPTESVDTSVRNASGAYERHIVETLRPKDGELDLARFLPPEPVAA